jgi:hypothetical protein
MIGGPAPRRRRILAAVALAATFAAFAFPSEAGAAPADALRDLFAALRRCLVIPAAPVGSELTIRFSLRRDGALLGKPQITFAKLSGGAAEQRRFAEAVGAAFDRCLPAAITAALGGAIAGRPLFITFLVQPRQAKT